MADQFRLGRSGFNFTYYSFSEILGEISFFNNMQSILQGHTNFMKMSLCVFTVKSQSEYT